MVLAEIGPSQDAMEVGREGSPCLTDLYMVDTSGLHLKWARSSLRLA